MIYNTIDYYIIQWYIIQIEGFYPSCQAKPIPTKVDLSPTLVLVASRQQSYNDQEQEIYIVDTINERAYYTQEKEIRYIY